MASRQKVMSPIDLVFGLICIYILQMIFMAESITCILNRVEKFDFSFLFKLYTAAPFEPSQYTPSITHMYKGELINHFGILCFFFSINIFASPPLLLELQNYFPLKSLSSSIFELVSDYHDYYSFYYCYNYYCRCNCC